MRELGWKNWSVKPKVLVMMISVFLTLSVALFQLTTTLTQKEIRNILYQYLNLHQEKAQAGFEFLIGEVNMLSVRLLTKSDIYATIGNGKLTKEQRERQLGEIIDGMSLNRELVGHIVIETKDGETYHYGRGSLLEQPGELFLQKLKSAPIAQWSDIRKDAGGQAYVMVGREYKNFYTGQHLGWLIVYVKESALYDVFKNTALAEWGDSFLLSNDRYILSASDPALKGTTLYDSDLFKVGPEGYKIEDIGGSRKIVTLFHLTGDVVYNGLDWSVVSILSQKQLFHRLDTIKLYFQLIQILIILTAVLISWYAAKQIVNPINLLSRNIRRFGDGEGTTFRTPRGASNNNELTLLENSYNDMVVRIEDLIVNINENKDKQQELELIALQAQINPHFLYNTLDAIGWLAKMSDQWEIEKMIIELAKFYRLCLHKGDKYILVDEEIGIVESYVELEKMRFPGKFSITYEIEDRMKAYKMLKLVLQPFVENAFKHGIAQKRGEGHVLVKGYAEGEDLIFEISDDGPGFDVEQIGREQSQNEYKGGGYGILNVDARIRLEYGDSYGIDICSERGKGTTTRVKIKAYS
jgi:two-component system sensor histidine kinase YesM